MPKSISQDTMNEEQREIAAAKENRAHFRPLYNRYYEPVFRFVLRRTSDEALTADLCSQVFLKAMENLYRYEFKGVPFSAWLFRIASNEVAQHFRNLKKTRTVAAEENTFAELADEVIEEEEGITREQLLATLERLKEDDMQLIELRFFEQRPFKEIAEILNITENNAKVKTYRILQRMRKRLIESTQN
ncbi:MAG: sigma-70 family RNA polymerase sigma factor [Bacteroidota bacterium]